MHDAGTGTAVAGFIGKNTKSFYRYHECIWSCTHALLYCSFIPYTPDRCNRFFAKGFTTKDIITPGSPFLFRPPDIGFPLPGVYAIWFIVVLILFPLCKRCDRYKSIHKKWWLSYL